MRVIQLGPCAPALSQHEVASCRAAIIQASLEVGGPGFGEPGAPGPRHQFWYKYRSKFGSLAIVPRGHRIFAKKPVGPIFPPVLQVGPLSNGEAAFSSIAPPHAPAVFPSAGVKQQLAVGGRSRREGGVREPDYVSHGGPGFTAPSPLDGPGAWLPPVKVKSEPGTFAAPFLDEPPTGMGRPVRAFDHSPPMGEQAHRNNVRPPLWDPPSPAPPLFDVHPRGPGPKGHMMGLEGGLRGPAPEQAVSHTQGRLALLSTRPLQNGGPAGLRLAHLEGNVTGCVLGSSLETGGRWGGRGSIGPALPPRVPQSNYAEAMQPSSRNSWSHGRGPHGQLPNQGTQLGCFPTSIPRAASSLPLPGQVHIGLPWPITSPSPVGLMPEPQRPHGAMPTFGPAPGRGTKSAALGVRRDDLPKTPSGQMRCVPRNSQGGKRSALHSEIVRFADECAVSPEETNSVLQACSQFTLGLPLLVLLCRLPLQHRFLLCTA